ncbi:MAG: GNAT family N-acetyltransferase [Bacteroidota bacterium]
MGQAIRYYKRSEIDDARWNEALDGFPNRTIYSYSWYLDSVAPQWGALIMGDYVAIMPLPFKRKYGVDYLYTPAYCQQLGLFCSTPDDQQLLEMFLAAIPSRYKYVDINLNAGNKCSVGSVKVFLNKNLVLAFKENYHSMADGFSTNHRRNIRKAVDSGLVVSEINEIDGLIHIFEKGRGSKLGSYPDKNHELLRSLFLKLHVRGKALAYGAFSEAGVLLGGALFFIHQKVAYFIFSGVSDEGKQCSCMHLLVSRFLELQSGKLDFLDFEGSNNPDLARFYSGFGADESLYLRIVINRLPLALRWLKS